MVGPGKGIDTKRYFVVCSNILGSCMGSTGPGSINPQTERAYWPDFPVVTIGDMVTAQKALIDHLGIRETSCGRGRFHWRYAGPGVVPHDILKWFFRLFRWQPRRKHSALAIAFNEVASQAIMADPNWNNGRLL